MRQNRYPNGYQPKIEYWDRKLGQAINALDSEGIKYAAEKLAYFVLREKQVNERLEQLYK